MVEDHSEQRYTPLPKPLRITEQQWTEGTAPLVSITCITYNHASFIRDAIEGFLMQETTFPVEILIHDDASTDGTADIVRDYEARYPHLIKAIYQRENQYSRGLKSSRFLRPLQRGVYIAFCEGDDYWTDPAKLEIQVEHLQDHPECVISGHDAFIIDEYGNRVSDSKLPDGHKKDYGAEDLLHGRAWILTMTWVYRNVMSKDWIPEKAHITNGDLFTTSLLGHYGGSKYHTDIAPACYRVHPGGIWSKHGGIARRDEHINTFFWIYRYYKRVGEKDLEKYWFRQWQLRVVSTCSAAMLIGVVLRRVRFVSGVARLARSIVAQRGWPFRASGG